MTKKTDMIIYLILLAVVAVIAVAAARTIANRYETLVNTALGLAVLYFSYRVYSSPRGTESEPLSVRIPLAKLMGQMASGFLLVMVIYWALRYVVYGVLELISALTTG